METARDAAAQYVQPLPAALGGRVFRLAVFDADEHCRFFFPRRALGFQQQMNTAIAREIRKRGGKVERLMFTPDEYRSAGGGDSPDERRAWIEHRTGLLS